MGSFLGFLRAISLLQVIFLASLLSAEKRYSKDFLISDVKCREEKHFEEYCAMYDICGARSDGKVLNCPYGSPSVKPDELFSAKIQSLCPTISGNVCCTEAQFDTLRTQVQQAIPFLVGCPACLRNFLNLFCELSCSPDQSKFINVTSTSEVNGNLTVDGIDYYITDNFGEGLYDSCKEVKFGTMNTRAMEFIGAGAKNFKEWFAFIGMKAAPGIPGSPYSIDFKSSISESSGMEPMNVSVYSCADTSLGCSCGDCPLAPACSSSEPPSPSKEEACSIRIGSLKVRCIELSVAILYVLFVSAFLGWGLFHRTRERRTPSSVMEPLLNALHDEIDSDKIQKNESNNGVESVKHTINEIFTLEYPGVSPELSFLKDSGRAEFHTATDEEALDAYRLLCRLEGIFPALEACHALAFLDKLCPTLPNGTKVVVNLSGRGDKDAAIVFNSKPTQL